MSTSIKSSSRIRQFQDYTALFTLWQVRVGTEQRSSGKQIEVKWIAGVNMETFSLCLLRQRHKTSGGGCATWTEKRQCCWNNGVSLAGGVAVKGKDRGQGKTVASDCNHYIQAWTATGGDTSTKHQLLRYHSHGHDSKVRRHHLCWALRHKTLWPRLCSTNGNKWCISITLQKYFSAFPHSKHTPLITCHLGGVFSTFCFSNLD